MKDMNRLLEFMPGSRHELMDSGDFSQDIDVLTDTLAKSYSLQDEVYANSESISRSSKGKSLNSVKSYLDFVTVDVSLRESSVNSYVRSHLDRGPEKIDLAGVAIDKTTFIDSLNNNGNRVDRKQMFGVVANGIARLKLLLREDDHGIPVTYATGRAEANDALKLLNKVALKTYELQDDRQILNLDDMLKDAERGFGAKKALVIGAGAVAIASCSGGMPTESKPNLDPTLTAPSSVLETPVPGKAEFESDVPGKFGEMSETRMVELYGSFVNGKTVEYQQGIDPTDGVVKNIAILVAPELKQGLDLRTGFELTEAGGGKSEFLVFDENGRQILVRNNPDGTSVLLELTFPEIGLQQWGVYRDVQGNYPVNQPNVGEGAFVPWLTMSTDGVWMYSPADNKLHKVEGWETHFKNASPTPINTMFFQEDQLESQYGQGDYERVGTEAPTLTFDNGMKFEWNGTEYVPVVDIASSEEGKNAIAIFNELKVDPSTYELKMDGDVIVGIDKEAGKEVMRDGEFELHFLQQALANSGQLEATNYKPETGNVPKNSNWPTTDLRINYLLPLHIRWREEYKKLHGVDPYKKGSSFFDGFLINPQTLSWGSVWTQKKDGAVEWRELIWTTVEGEVMSVRIMPNISVQTYWMD